MSRCSGCALWSFLTQQGQAQVLRVTVCFVHPATAGGMVCTFNDQYPLSLVHAVYNVVLMINDVYGYVYT